MTINRTTVTSAFFVFIQIIFINASQARPLDRLYQRYLDRQQKNQEQKLGLIPPSFGVATEVFTQKLNPSDPQDSRVFPQRYWIDSSFAVNAEAPVLLIICGEGPCSSSDLSRKPIIAWAKKLGAHRIAVEHRYYGASQPFDTLTSENLQYLTVENALSDLISLQKEIQQKLGWTGKWISIGGSYAGALSAYLRLSYPEQIAGALASSAPVQAKSGFEEYDWVVSRGAGAECGAAMKRVVAKIEALLDQPAELAQIQKKFGSSDIREPMDFIYIVADMAAAAIQYGFRDQFCGKLTQNSDELQAYATAGLEVFARLGITPLESSFQSAEALKPGSEDAAFEMRQWMYQSCTQFGFYQVAHHDPAVSVRSALLDEKYHNTVCKRLFGIEKPVDVEGINQRYYQPLMAGVLQGAKNILFTNGSTDPWSALSLTVENGTAVNPLLNYNTIEGAAHCDDLGSRQSTPLSTARELFSQLAQEWGR